MPGGKEAVPLPSELVLIKLASLAVHVQEEAETGTGSSSMDALAARGLASDPDVVGWLATVDPALLPVKREEG